PIVVIHETVEKRAEFGFHDAVLGPIIAPPTNLGESPTAFIALTSPMESLIYEQRKSTSGLILFRSSMYGVKLVVDKGYLPSKTTRMPCRARLSLAPWAGLCENGASATRMATVSGFGCCCPATSKKPSVRARCGCGPVGIITKYCG